ncbi:MAG TPA: O-antigen ligase family protein [Candidatus Limnocylindrales bacterium]|nr:O-antigen ligase family protein [Candidatus Limnocylindrales bacterium]
MSRVDPVGWARDRSAIEWLALGAALPVFGYVGWDGALWDARVQLLLHLLAIGAIGGLAVVALRGGLLPRTPLDLPLLGLLAAIALATASALNVGMSLRAMAAIVAFAAMLPVALLAVRHRPGWVGLVTSVPVLLLSIPTLVTLVARRIEWIAAGAPGLPPLRLPSEGTPFGSVAVPPFVLIPAWALAGLIEPPALRRAVRVGLVGVGVPLVILSGSRSAWLAIAAGSAVGVLPWAWRQRGRLRWPGRLSARGILLGAGALAVGGLVLALAVPRLTAVSALLYRGALWRDTLVAWSSDPLLGIGPGFMPYARQAAAADFSFPVRQPHSHNLPLGVLGDAGVVGLAAGLIVVGTLALRAGPWRSRSGVGRTAAVVLVGLGVGGLFEDLTFLPGFNLLAITLVAVALLDAGAVTWAPIRLGLLARRSALLAGSGAIAVVLLGAMVTADAGAIAYRSGIEAAESADWTRSAAGLQRAVEIDPWHPAGPRALAVAADAAGQPALALDAAERATLRNPGDATAWANLALLCERDADAACAREAAERAVMRARYLAPELLNAAAVLDRLGETDAADAAYRLSLLTQPATSFVVEWPRSVAIGDGRIPDVADPSWQLNLLLARHATDEPLEPSEFSDSAVRALAHAANGEREEADRWLTIALDEHPDDIRTHDIAVILRDAWGEPIVEAVRIASVVRGRPFPDRDLEIGVPRTVQEIVSFRAYPRDGFVRSAVRLATRPPFPWILQGVLR